MLAVADLGRTASHYYITHETIDMYNRGMQPWINEAQALKLVSESAEFAQVKVRDEDMKEMDKLEKDACQLEVHCTVHIPYLLSDCWTRY